MPPTRSNTSATVLSSDNASPSPEPQGPKELPERSRNAKAQARHREKRKAYISHLEQSVATLKQQLASMGISGAIPAHALASSSSSGSPMENDARLRELVEENERLKTEIQRLRAKVESMGGSAASASSRGSTGGHHGLTPPATPGVLGGLGGSSTGALLPSDEAYDGRRGSVLGGPVESFLEGNSAQTTSHERASTNASTLFPSSSSSSSSQVPLSLHIPPSNHHPSSSAQPPPGLGISGLGGRPLSAGSHLAHHRYSLPSPLPPVLSSSSTPLLPHPTSSYTPSSSTPSSSSSQFNPTFRVQSPFGTPVDPSSGWQIPRGSAPSILTPNFLDYPPRGRELPLPNGFGLAPLASMHGLGAPPSGAGYDYLMVSSVRGSAQGGPTNGLANEFPSAVPPLAPAANVLPPFYGGNGGAESSGPSSSTLPPFSAATAAASYAYYGLPPNHPQHAMQQQQQQQQQQQSGPSSAPPSRANSQSRNDTTGSSSSSSPKSLSPGSPIIGGGGGGAAAGGPPPFGAESFKMQLEGGGGNEFGSGQGYEFGLSAAGTVAAVGAEQGQQWA